VRAGRASPIKIIWHSNSPWNLTGYGIETALFVPRIAALGHEIVISAPYTFSGAVLEWEGFKLLPAVGTPTGCDVLDANYRFFGADLMITLSDPFGLLPAVEDLAQMNVAHWFPVDCSPVGQPDVAVLREGAGIPVAMSRFGERMLRNEGADPLFVPHAVDTDLFSPGDPAPFRDSIGAAPDTFVVGVNAMNRDPVRKGLAEQFEAFARFHANHPDSLLVVHAQPENKSGLNLNQLALQLGISHAVSYPDTYRHAMFMITPEHMADWYRGLDVFSLCSYGEGFGIPLIEAQATGCPVVTTDASAMSELCGAGWLVSGTPWWHHNHNAWWKRPDVEDIYHAYEMAFEAKVNGTLPKEAAREFALQYDADRVLNDYWVPALKEIKERIGE
jgi:glycosyltransferase involved in cell wall biosynthesis